MFERLEKACNDFADLVVRYAPRQVPLSPTYPPLLLGLGSTLAINYLVHKPDTLLLRRALWPIAVVACLYTLITIDLSPYSQVSVILCTFLCLAASSASRWALSKIPPDYHVLPRSPPLSFVRQLDIVKSLNLILDESRLTGIAPYSPPMKRAKGGYLRHFLYNTILFLFFYVVYDISTYPIFSLDPNGIGLPSYGRKDYNLSVLTMSLETGLPPSIIQLWLAIMLGWNIYIGMRLMWHMEAMLAIGSGIWVAEEFRPLFDKPWAADSLNDLWAHRYHQPKLTMVTRPFRFLPRSTQMFLIFAASAIYHALIHFPCYRHLALWPSLHFFLGCGLGCVLERAAYKITGKKASGFWGRIWVWTWMLLIAGPLTENWYASGWAGGFRRDLWEEPSQSPVEWLLYAIRGGTSPADVHRRRA